MNLASLSGLRLPWMTALRLLTMACISFIAAAQEPPLIGTWGSQSQGFSWSIEISATWGSRGEYLHGVLVDPWPFFKKGEEVLILQATSVPGVFEGRQKWKNALHISTWAPARIVANGDGMFTQFNSVSPKVALAIGTEWVYLKAQTRAIVNLLTNADVVSLVSAGLSDQVIIEKIISSRVQFKLDTAELVALKKAGASDDVVSAMIRGSKR